MILLREGVRNAVAHSEADSIAVEKNPGPLGLWTLVIRNSGAYFDPSIVPSFLGNLPMDLASEVINSGASVQAAAVGTTARPLSFGVYDAAMWE